VAETISGERRGETRSFFPLALFGKASGCRFRAGISLDVSHGQKFHAHEEKRKRFPIFGKKA